jgi:hypothetical protein
MHLRERIQMLLSLKARIEHVKAMKRTRRTDREREVLQESLQRAYDRAECLLTPERMQALASETTREKGVRG